MDPGDGNRDLLVIGVELAPVVAGDRRPPTDLAELLRVCLFDPALPAPPIIPPLLLGTLQVRAPTLGPRDPSDVARDGTPWLDARGEVMAEERRAGVHSATS